MNRDFLLNIIFDAIKNINEERESEDQIPIHEDIVLMGADALIDSITLVTLIVDVETEVSLKTGIDIYLTNDDAISQDVSPFISPKNLVNYMIKIIESKND